MEILNFSTITEAAWWFIVAVGATLFGAIIALLAALNDHYIVALIFAFIVLAGLIVIFVAPHEISTDKMSYTIEITDSAQYQILVEKGYSFKRLFENKEIYTIIGDVLQ